MIEIVLKGSYEECRRDAEALFGIAKPIPVPVGVLTVKPDATAVKAAETPSDAPAAKAEETVAEAAETAVNAQETQETSPAEDAGENPSASAEAPSLSGQAGENPSAYKEDAPVITMVEARAKMNEVRQRLNAGAVRQILDQLGYAKFTDVPASVYPQLMVCCDAMVSDYAQ